MPLNKMNSLAALGLASTLAGPAIAGVVHTEPGDGELSGNRAAPTFLNFAPGHNDVFGQVGCLVCPPQTPVVAERDYFTFVVPAGNSLVSIVVLNVELSAGASQFLGLQAGVVVTVDPAAATAAPLLGYHHTAPADVGDDILPLVATAAGAIGFTPPLGPGPYSVWLQDGHPFPSEYGLRFVVPEPGTALLVVAGIAALGRFRRRQPTAE